MGKEPLKNILVSRTDHLGDVLLATPLVTVLKRLFPDAKISFLADPVCAPVPEHHPAVSQVLRFPSKDKHAGLGTFLKLVAALKTQKFDAIFLVYPDWRVTLAAFFARIPRRIGTGYRIFSFLFNRRVYFHRSKGEKKHEILFNLELLKALPEAVEFNDGDLAPRYQINKDEIQRGRAWLKEKGFLDEFLIAVHPGSFGSALNWDAAHYAEAAQALAEKYDATVILTGTTEERDLAEQVKNLLKAPSFNAAGLTDLPLLASLYKQCMLFLGSSTGPVHLAAAVGTPSIGIYCPITVCGPWRWRPWGRHTRAILSASFMDCPSCLKDRCPYFNCMNLITVDQVMQAAGEIIKVRKRVKI